MSSREHRQAVGHGVRWQGRVWRLCKQDPVNTWTKKTRRLWSREEKGVECNQISCPGLGCGSHTGWGAGYREVEEKTFHIEREWLKNHSTVPQGNTIHAWARPYVNEDTEVRDNSGTVARNNLEASVDYLWFWADLGDEEERIFKLCQFEWSFWSSCGGRKVGLESWGLRRMLLPPCRWDRGKLGPRHIDAGKRMHSPNQKALEFNSVYERRYG